MSDTLSATDIQTIDKLIAESAQDIIRHKTNAEELPIKSIRSGDQARALMKLAAEARIVNTCLATRRQMAGGGPA